MAHEIEHAHGVRVEHADGTIDFVDEKAIGGDSAAMPDGYFRSAPFIFTVIAICFGNICAYTGWVLPANTLCVYPSMAELSRLYLFSGMTMC